MHIIIRLLKINDKEKTLKQLYWGKKTHVMQKIADFASETL